VAQCFTSSSKTSNSLHTITNLFLETASASSSSSKDGQATSYVPKVKKHTALPLQPLQSPHTNKYCTLNTISCTYKSNDKTTEYLFKLIFKWHINRTASLQPGLRPATAQIHYQSGNPFTTTVTALLDNLYGSMQHSVCTNQHVLYLHALYLPCLASIGETSSRGWRSAKTMGSWGTFPTLLCTSDTELLDNFCGTVSMTRSNMMPYLVLQTLATWTGKTNAFNINYFTFSQHGALGYNTMYSGRGLPMCQMKILPLHLQDSNKQSQKSGFL